MPIAVTEEHESLRRTAGRWLQAHCPPEVPRGVAEAAPAPGRDTGGDGRGLPDVWQQMAAQGWLGLHVPEAHGGQGYTLAETAVVVEELGHVLFPGPLLPTLLVSAALVRHPDERARAAYLPGLADGTVTAAVALGAEPLRPTGGGGRGGVGVDEGGELTVSGTLRPVLGLPTARLVLVPIDGDEAVRHGGCSTAKSRATR